LHWLKQSSRTFRNARRWPGPPANCGAQETMRGRTASLHDCVPPQSRVTHLSTRVTSSGSRKPRRGCGDFPTPCLPPRKSRAPSLGMPHFPRLPWTLRKRAISNSQRRFSKNSVPRIGRRRPAAASPRFDSPGVSEPKPWLVGRCFCLPQWAPGSLRLQGLSRIAGQSDSLRRAQRD